MKNMQILSGTQKAQIISLNNTLLEIGSLTITEIGCRIGVRIGVEKVSGQCQIGVEILHFFDTSTTHILLF